MVRRNTLPAAPSPISDTFARTLLRSERLEARDTPSAGVGEDVLSLPHLPGMGSTYPTEVQPPAPTVKKPLLQEAPQAAIGRVLVGGPDQRRPGRQCGPARLVDQHVVGVVQAEWIQHQPGPHVGNHAQQGTPHVVGRRRRSV